MHHDGAPLHQDKLAYAVALLDGASRLAATARTQNIGEIGIPFHLLIGFSLENGLKALLEFKKHREPGFNWSRSHDLAKLLSAARGYGLHLQVGIFEVVDGLSQYHSEFWFRYPEKARVANVVSSTSTLFATEHLLVAVYRLVGLDHPPPSRWLVNHPLYGSGGPPPDNAP